MGVELLRAHCWRASLVFDADSTNHFGAWRGYSDHDVVAGANSGVHVSAVADCFDCDVLASVTMHTAREAANGYLR
jgi:hypothetical protein